MAENVLEKIIKKKIEKIENLKKTISIDSLDKLINTNKTFINFKKKIENNIKESKYNIYGCHRKWLRPLSGKIKSNT